MAIDQTPTAVSAEAVQTPAIENEFPTYRAISSAAVLSLICGLGSVFCFADLWFLLLVAVAVILGIFAMRKIRQFPEVLTGTGLARVGIGVSLLFGLSALTQMLTQEITINIDAGQFARTYVGILKDDPLSVAIWYQQPAAYRKTKSPDELVDELKASKSPNGDPFQQRSEPVARIKDRLKTSGEMLTYSQIETKAVDGLTVYANALLKLEGPGNAEHPEQKEEFALVQLVRSPEADRLDWVVKEIVFPYTPRSAVATVEKKAADDGHGH